jgi:aminopeptidase
MSASPSIDEKYAQVLAEYSMRIAEGDKVLICGSYLAQSLIREVYKQAVIRGAHPETKIQIPGTEKIFYDHASDKQLKYISMVQKLYYNEYDCLLNIDSPFNLKELQNIDASKKQAVSIARTELNKVFMDRSAAGSLRWTLCVYPTNSGAQEAGMSLGEYEDFVYSACFLYDDDPVASWRELSQRQQAVVDQLNNSKFIEYKSDDVDVSFSCEGRKWINSAGTFNMPSGEVFTTPVEDSVNGRVRFSYPGIFMGQEIEDISLEIKDGLVVKWDAKKGRELLDKVFEIEGARRFGEAAIGTNKGIQKFTRNMLFDEKIGGTIHMAVGAAYPETGGKNESSIHWDLLADMKQSYIKADGKVVYENGEFII